MLQTRQLSGFDKYLPDGVLGNGKEAIAALEEQRLAIQAMDAAPRAFTSNPMFGLDASVGGGQAFLVGELEKRDPKVREPLASITYPRDIPIKEGGGWVDITSNMYVDYAISGANGLGIQANQTTTIPIIQANLLKDLYQVFAWGNILRVNFIDMKKLEQVPRSLDDMLDKGVKLSWNKALDQVTYLGPLSNTTFPGLINNPNVTAASAAVGAAGSTLWSKKTPMEILADVNTIMVNTVAASQYDVTGMCNHILIPWAQYALICSQIVSEAGNVSILTYLLENNIGKTQGIDLKIFPSRWNLGAGSGSTDRMAGYVNNDDRVQLDVTVPIQRIMTVPNIGQGGGSYDTLYQGQFGVVKFLYLQAAAYADGI
jgi:hypothetical protein